MELNTKNNKDLSAPGVDCHLLIHVCINLQGSLLVGTKDSEVILINEKSGQGQSLIQGHGEGELWGLSTHCNQPKYATASDDGTVRVWDLANKVLLIFKIDSYGI